MFEIHRNRSDLCSEDCVTDSVPDEVKFTFCHSDPVIRPAAARFMLKRTSKSVEVVTGRSST